MELQKYYSENGLSIAVDVVGPFYYASEADAHIESLKQQHAEEIERLKAEHVEGMSRMARRIKELSLQAERYEKLRRNLNRRHPHKVMDQFDKLVDQLP